MFELVLDQQDRQPFGLQLGDQPLHLRRLGRIHAGRRLVEQQQTRLQRQRARDLDAAAIGVGQAVGRLVDARQQPLAETRQDGPHLFAQSFLLGLYRSRSQQRQSQFQQRTDQRCRRPDGAQPRMRADQDVLHHAEIAEDTAKLERARDATGRQFLRRKTGDDLPIETDLAGIGPVEPGHEIEQRGLAGAVRADDADQIALGEVEIDAVDGGQSAEAPRQSAQRKQRRFALLRHQIVPNRPCGRNRTSSSSTMP